MNERKILSEIPEKHLDTTPVFAGDVRSSVDRVLTMLEGVDTLIGAGDARSLTQAEGLLAGALTELREFSENLR